MAEKDFRVRKGILVDGTASNPSLTVTTGNIVVAAGTVGLTNGILLSTDSGVSLISSQPTNGHIKIAPNGNGDIVFDTDNLDVSADSMKISIKDNVGAGLDITEAGTSYLKFVTSNGSEQIVFGKNSTFAGTTIANLGTVTTADINGGTIDATDITVGNSKTLDVSGGTLVLGNGQISGDKVSGGTIGTTTITALAGALSLGDNSITNVGGIALDEITADGTTITIKPDDNQAAAFTITDAGSTVFMKVDTSNSAPLVTFPQDVVITGTTPKLTIGDAGAEDTFLIFDGAEINYRLGIDDSANQFEIGVGDAHDTTAAIIFNNAAHIVQLGQETPNNNDVLSWNGNKWTPVVNTGGLSISSSDNKLVRTDGNDDIQGSGISVDDSNNVSSMGTLGVGNVTSTGTIIGTTITSSLGLVSTKDVDSEFVALTLNNQSDSNNANGFVSQLFNLEDTSGNTVDAGKISVKKVQAFTNTATTQDSNMSFYTSLNGTLTEQVVIDSSGRLDILNNGITTSKVITPTGTLTDTFIGLNVYNQDDSSNTAGAAGVRFTLEGSDGLFVPAGQIAAHKVNAITDQTNTRNTQLVFSTNKQNTFAERMWLNENGDLILSGRLMKTDANGFDIKSNAGIKFFIDVDNDTTNNFEYANGAGTVISSLDESGNLIINGDLKLGGNNIKSSNGATAITLSGGTNVTIAGNLTVQGDTITANVATLNVEDKNILLNAGTGDNTSTADGAGITIQNAVNSSTNASLLWAATPDRFVLSHGLDVTGTLTADTSITLDSTTITTAELGVLDGITGGTVTASKAVVVDGSKDISAFRNLSGVALTGSTSVTTPSLITDYSKITTTQHASGVINVNAVTTIATIVSTTHRGAEILTTVYNATDNTTDLFKTVVMWDGHDTTLNDSSAACHYTNYAVLSSGDVPNGDISAVKSNANILVKFTATGGSNAGNDTYIIRSQQTLLEI